MLLFVMLLVLLTTPVYAASEVTPGSRTTRNDSGPVEWIGFAASPQGRIFQSDVGRGEVPTRNEAKNLCESTTARTCAAISVPTNFTINAVKCTARGLVTTQFGASAQGNEYEYALQKVRNILGYVSENNCDTVFSW